MYTDISCREATRLLCVITAAFLPAIAAAQNLSIGAGADGSSKGSTSYGRVIDGKLGSAWSPVSTSNERVCVKWEAEKSIKRVVLRENGDTVTAWRLEQAGRIAEVFAKGTKIGAEHAIEFEKPVSSKKICLVIESAEAPPAIAEFETY